MNRAGAPTKRYVQIVETLYKSEAFRTIPGGALKLWLDVRTQYNGRNNGRLLITQRALAPRGWNSVSKMIRARDELLARGLIRLIKYCGKNAFHKASLFAFTDQAISSNDLEGISGSGPKHEYLSWTKGAVIYGLPNQESNDSRIGNATPTESGRRDPKTTPESGARKIDRKAVPTLVPRPKLKDAARLPESGDTYRSTTNPIGVNAAKLNGTHRVAQAVLVSPKPRAAQTSQRKARTLRSER